MALAADTVDHHSLLTGFEVNGAFTLFDFDTAVEVFNFVGLTWMSMEAVALVHTAVAFAILPFFVVHVYMITTGHTLFAHTRAMITGWEEVADEESVGEWKYKT